MRAIFFLIIFLSLSLSLPAKAQSREETIFSGVSQRFTAFRQHIYTKDWRYIEENELQNGNYLVDINLTKGGGSNYIVDVKADATYKVYQKTSRNPEAEKKGFSYQYDIPEINGSLLLNPENGVVSLIFLHQQTDRFYEIHYIQATALLCTALLEMKTRVQGDMATSIFKEILVVAIKSYAGASYRGGTFSGYTESGSAFSGRYTVYDPSWLGAHYGRGLDVIFNGTASILQINNEINKYGCGDTPRNPINKVVQPSAITQYEKNTYELPKSK